jgi:hypothetical protein
VLLRATHPTPPPILGREVPKNKKPKLEKKLFVEGKYAADPAPFLMGKKKKKKKIELKRSGPIFSTVDVVVVVLVVDGRQHAV